jgi:hypothetical protein
MAFPEGRLEGAELNILLSARSKLALGWLGGLMPGTNQDNQEIYRFI